MTAPNCQSTRVVADVGGTNTRLAVFDPVAAEFRAVASYTNRDYPRFEALVSQWLEALGEPRPRTCCIAVAAPPSGDRVTMVNMDWSFSCSDLSARFDFERLRCINDFEANAYSLPHLEAGDTELIHAGRGEEPGRLATVGPGTGLGGAVMEMVQGVPSARACEPGHMGLSPGTELELELFRALLPRHGNIYAELLVSGPGLQRLHRTLGEIRGEPTPLLEPGAISRLAVAGEDPLCTLALDTFCALLGSTCGDFLLANGAYAGLYLAGGILPGFIPFLRSSAFQQRLGAKGAMHTRLDSIPVYVITAGHPGLTGAAHAPLSDSGD